MQLKSLKLFCDVVRRRSFSRAADENGISQSSASQVVHQLEERLGVQLLDRSKRPFVLTAEGERYYDGCRQLVKQYAKLVDEVCSLHDVNRTGRLQVASIYSVGLAHMSAFMRKFSSAYPEVAGTPRVPPPRPGVRSGRKWRSRLGIGQLPRRITHAACNRLAQRAAGCRLSSGTPIGQTLVDSAERIGGRIVCCLRERDYASVRKSTAT